MRSLLIALLWFLLAAVPPASAQPSSTQDIPPGSDVVALFAAGDVALAAGNPAQALVHYLHAQAYVPRDPALQERIAWARYLLGTPPSRLPLLLAVDYAARPWLTLTEIGTAAWLLFCVLCASAVPLLRGASLPAFYRPAVVLFLPLVVSAVLLYVARFQVAHLSPPGVAAETTTLFSGPAMTYLPLEEISAGRELYAVENRDGWVRVVTVDGQQGWLPADYVVSINQTGTEAE